jgi:hypothetical protein
MSITTHLRPKLAEGFRMRFRSVSERSERKSKTELSYGIWCGETATNECKQVLMTKCSNCSGQSAQRYDGWECHLIATRTPQTRGLGKVVVCPIIAAGSTG